MRNGSVPSGHFMLVTILFMLSQNIASSQDINRRIQPITPRPSIPNALQKTLTNTQPEKVVTVGFSGKTIKDVSGNFAIDFEQDWFVDWMPKTNYDRNYTQGTGFTYSKYDLDESPIFLPLRLVHRLLYNSAALPDYLIKMPASVSVGVTAFTPLDIASNKNPVFGDRPFANVAFITTGTNSYNKKMKVFTSTSFSYGIIGSNVANTFQSYAHAHIIKGRPTDIGWEHQISRGGHAAFLFTHSAMRNVVDIRNKTKEKSIIQGSLSSRINIGWYSGIATTAGIKIGLFSKFTNSNGLQNSLAVANSAPSFRGLVNGQRVRHVPVLIKPRYRFDWFIFGNASPRFTPHNSLVLGQPGVESVYTLPKETYNPLFVDSEYGIFLSLLKTVDDLEIPLSRIDLILSVNSRTSEIVSKDPTKENPYQRRHTWGRITLRFPML